MGATLIVLNVEVGGWVGDKIRERTLDPGIFEPHRPPKKRKIKGEKPTKHSCPYCSKKVGNIDHHVSIRHVEKWDDYLKEIFPKNPLKPISGKLLERCDICGAFVKKLRNHLDRAHRGVVVSPQEDSNGVDGYLEKYYVDHLHYMTPMDNVDLILASGILSYNKATALPHRSVALIPIQTRRESVIPQTGRCVHDYVPLYFAIHTPMQYVITTPAPTKKREQVLPQDKLVFIEVDAKKIFRMHGVIFTDGNAASNETRFYSSLADLENLDWDSIWLPNKWPQCYDRDWQRKKASEVLVPDCIPVEFFSRIVVYSHEAADELARKIKTKSPANNWNNLSKYTCSVDPTHYL